ncbi:uncharacterized protein LOC124891563 [Capsicum annuum]|uniref:uncharacterized protein LOC124891563 n=1 Tax=Capsicum annuum TaxID=4072 RepID=UPI001FB112D5|nr:uncharacterized protein LOC124891563 [Capsicum annuum]
MRKVDAQRRRYVLQSFYIILVLGLLGPCPNFQMLLVSETIAILEAARYCVAHNVLNLILETDSLFLKNIITSTWKLPWSVTVELEEIGELLENLNVQVTHVMREGNQLADYLANSALEYIDIIVHSFNELDSQGMKIINSDKLQCPYLRVRAARRR